MTEQSQGETWISGHISRYDLERGYGVIRGDDGEDYYLHYREIVGTWEPEEQSTVRFRAERHRKGNLAKHVTLA
ncbi:MAG: cold-shock protein [Oceanococcaceae bacterium]